MNLKYLFSTKKELEMIHENSLRVLEEVGVIFHNNPEALEYFKKYGAKIDGDHVYIPKKLVEKAVQSAPSTYEWIGREKNVTIGTGPSKNLPAYGPMFIYENGKYHATTHEDTTKFHKLHETSNVMDVSSPMVLDASYIDKNVRNDYKMTTALKYCVKPLMGITDGKDASVRSIEVVQQFYDIFDKIVVTGLINCSSPLLYAAAMSEAIIEYSKKGQALCITGSCTSGLTGPTSIAGIVVQGNAEVLAGLVLSQLVNEGTPVVYCLNFSSCDLRYATCELGGAEGALLAYTARELATFYQLPLRSGGGLTDSKQIDFQAGFETFMIMLATYQAKIDFVTHSCGILDTMNSLSYEKYILDEELILIINRLLRGYEVTEKTIQFDKIKKVGPGGNFMGKTEKMYLNDYFLPKYSNRMTHGNWINMGQPTIVENTHNALQKRLHSYVLPDITNAQQKILKKYYQKIENS